MVNKFLVKYIVVSVLLLSVISTANAAVLNQSQFGAFAQNNASGYVDGNPIGGGTGYNRIILPTNTSICAFAENSTQLIAALASCPSGKTVYINETVNMNVSGVYYTAVPSGVTVASNRGYNGSAGGRLFMMVVDGSGWRPIFNITGNNARVTGLRLEGPYLTTFPAIAERGEKDAISNPDFSGLEVDNNEIFGWSHAAVYTNISNTTLAAEGLLTPEIGSSITNIHHNYIHNCQVSGEGYGSALKWGSVLIKGNLFTYMRHSTASSGMPGSGYEASYNMEHTKTPTINSPTAISHIFDVHGYPTTGGIAGQILRVHHNTVIPNMSASVYIRGNILGSATLTMNYFTNNSDTTNTAGYGCSVWKNGTSDNVTMKYNIIDGIYVPGGQVCLK